MEGVWSNVSSGKLASEHYQRVGILISFVFLYECISTDNLLVYDEIWQIMLTPVLDWSDVSLPSHRWTNG